jgi:predicted negative regulator of RcsB-dependent stress response
VKITDWIIIAVVVIGAVIAFFGWDRYRGNRNDAASSTSQPTSEVFNDPDTGRRMRVWYDPSTGRREYRAEANDQ